MSNRELNRHDLVWCVRRLPKTLLAMMKTYGHQIVVAGGFIRSCVANETVNDVDVFCASKELAEKFAKELATAARGGKPHETDNAYTVRVRGNVRVVQFIHRWTFDKPIDVVASFDFTIAQSALWYSTLDKEFHSTISASFYEDLAAKRLIYTAPVRNEDAGGSLLRVLKFYQRGYRIPLDSLGAVIARLVVGVKLLDPTEKTWAYILTSLLVEVDPAIDPTHEAHISSLHPEHTKDETAS